MKDTKYSELKHEFPEEMAPELEPYRERVLFARWLVQMGHLSDWGIEQQDAEATAGERELVASK